MDKDFFSVFPDLEVDADTRQILSQTKIERISTNVKHDHVRIYAHFSTLLPKRRIRKLEDDIRRSYFSKEKIEVNIIERYHLMGDFSPEVVFNSYRDSIYEEMDAYNSILFSIIKHADFSFEESHKLCLSLEDTAVAHQREDELWRIFDMILNERLGQKVTINVSYKKPHESRYIKDSDERIKNRIAQIVAARQAVMDGEADGEEYMSVGAKGSKREVSAKPAEKKKAVSKEKSADFAEQKNGSARGNRTAAGSGERSFVRRARRSDNPEVLFGREFEGETTHIADLTEGMLFAIICGQILMSESRTLKSGDRKIISFNVTDFTDTIPVKLFVSLEEADELEKTLSKGAFVRVCGSAEMDSYSHEVSMQHIRGIMRAKDFRTKRMDVAAEKRVELHCHTKMSEMDATNDVSDFINTANEWGHRAIAITDHGVVQAFPDAAIAAKGKDVKVIYGVEAYLVDDTKQIAANVKGQRLDVGCFVIFDLETTGLNSRTANIIEIGAVKYEDGKITDRFSEFVNPKMPIPFHIVELTSITDEMVRDAETVDVVLPRFKEFCGDAVLVAHNADFDTGCITAQCIKLGIDWDFTYMDTIPMAKYLLPNLKRFGLHTVANALSVSLEHHHRAVDDAEATAHIFEKLVDMMSARGIHSLEEMNEAGRMTPERIKTERPHHVILLARNDLGRVHLYRLVSDSHLKYFHMKPKLPKSLIEEYREGLIIGSACSAGELYEAVLEGKTDEEIARIVEFYDYLEIQPIGNNGYLLQGSDNKYGTETEEDLRNINRRIVALGKEFRKLVCATGDVHFLNPEDEIYRRIIQAGSKSHSDSVEQPPLYLRTTEEMLAEFAYLGEDKAREVVITNTNKICDMCERIAPVRPDKAPPVIKDSDVTLRKICYTRAKEIYGDELPEVVTERLERELNSIISNGYAVMYIIAQKLVWKSVEDGYLVGSRGSVGSSFVATMAGITEVNPLHAHYICPSCHYVDFDSPEVRAFDGRAGCDMPDKDCPVCGHKLIKDGFDIPFETFLGFKGDKEPDIDLNFSNDYQNKAHRYTEVIFGEGQTFRAGTIGTLADKTAYGYAMHYFEDIGEHKRSCEIDRIIQGCVGVRRTTGQHPGGIVVLPLGEDIYSFTPIQHPANKEIDIITTHFDYHKIEQNLLKLDILGHLDPTVIRMLEDLVPGMKATEIPLDDKAVMSLFMNTEALGVSPEDLWDECKLGTLGIPEFGTDFAMGMLIDAKPKEFTDLVRIAGLAHGTDVWLGNAKDLILEGKATISTAICTRDDIMTYLIGMGLESEESFKIMEAVRKGTVAKGKCDKWPEWRADMEAHEVPDWYIGSCEKIKYMFPKAHAAAYVMMAWRVAYCKINYPLAYYAAYFSIRMDTFSYELMCFGKERVEANLRALSQKRKELKKEKKDLTAKEQDLYMDLRSVQEMYARGFSFTPMDIYTSDPFYFKIEDGKLLPPLNTIDGMGDIAAETLSIEAARGKFLSKDDLRSRGKVSQTVVETMEKLGVISGLPESNQLSIFDF